MRRTAKAAEIAGEEHGMGLDSDFTSDLNWFSDLVELWVRARNVETFWDSSFSTSHSARKSDSYLILTSSVLQGETSFRVSIFKRSAKLLFNIL